MKKFYAVVVCSIFSVVGFGAHADDVSGLTVAIQNARAACVGISDSMSKLKTMAGINTAVTGVGTVSSGVALGAGIMKSAKDKEFYKGLIKDITSLADVKADVEYRKITGDMIQNAFDNIEKIDKKYENMDAESKKLGKIRTGTLAGTAVLDTAGTIIAANNKVDDDLQGLVDNCIKSIKNLQNEQIRARTENTASAEELQKSEKIIANCRDWEYLDLSKINKRATGAAVSGGVGAVLALTGTITSASANSNSVRYDYSDTGKQKAKNLNTASNVMAGGATAASGVATVFNATQISAIKKAADIADKCEEGLR